MKEFNEAMDKICPSDEQKSRMFDNALSMAEASSTSVKKRPKMKVIAVSLIAAAAMVGTTTAFADEIKTAFYNFFKDDSTISEQIIENIYEDTDGHVDFSVSRIVSDKMNTYAIVKYNALDETGKKWLDKRFASFYIVGKAEDILNRGLYIEPDNYEDHYVNFSFGLNDEEITDSDEDNSRVFKLSCNSNDVVFDSDYVKVRYVMSSGEERYARLNVSESVELIDIKLDSSIAADRLYTPTGVKLSPLGIMVYGKDKGWFSSNHEIEEHVDIGAFKVVTKDGSVIKCTNYISMSDVSEKEKGYDIQIISTFFKEPVDVDNIAGIWLDGVYFEF